MEARIPQLAAEEKMQEMWLQTVAREILGTALKEVYEIDCDNSLFAANRAARCFQYS